MKIYETKIIPAQTVQELVKIECDICHKLGTQKYCDDNWANSDFDIKSTHIEYEEGYSYPEGGHKTTFKLDLCPDCFKTYIIEYFEQKGVHGYTEEIDW